MQGPPDGGLGQLMEQSSWRLQSLPNRRFDAVDRRKGVNRVDLVVVQPAAPSRSAHSPMGDRMRTLFRMGLRVLTCHRQYSADGGASSDARPPPVGALLALGLVSVMACGHARRAPSAHARRPL
jgi:hypothetical protein